jgi:hypothetical protein
MEEFEQTLPQGFRETLVSIMGSTGMGPASYSEPLSATASSSSLQGEMGIRDARVTLLRAVAEGRMSPEEAEKLLFPD